MAGQAKQITFTQTELISAMIVAANLREGRWMLLATFSLEMRGGIKLPDGTVTVGTVSALNQIGLEIVLDGAPNMDGVTVVDAAEVNPRALKIAN